MKLFSLLLIFYTHYSLIAAQLLSGSQYGNKILEVNRLPVVTDTTAYLRDSIAAKRTFYVGKPLQTLFNNLWLPIKAYSGELPLPSNPDTIKVYRFALYFSESNKLIFKMTNQQKMPCIEVRFSTPILVPKSYFKKGGVLDASKGWTPEKANFYGAYTISDLRVRGL